MPELREFETFSGKQPYVWICTSPFLMVFFLTFFPLNSCHIIKVYCEQEATFQHGGTWVFSEIPYSELTERNAHCSETGCICTGSDSSLVVGGSLYVQYSTSEFYFWQRVNVRVFWEVCALLDAAIQDDKALKKQKKNKETTTTLSSQVKRVWWRHLSSARKAKSATSICFVWSANARC